MKKTRRFRSGNTVELVVIIVLVVAVLGLLGFIAWKQLTKPTEGTPAATNSKQAEAKKTYTSPTGHFSLQYPSNWTLGNEQTPGGLQGSSATLTSANGTVLTLRSDEGGRGGMCEPAETDVPFAKGNRCASKEYLSKEKLPIDTVYAQSGETYRQTDVYIVTAKTTTDTNGGLIYTLGVMSDMYGDYSITLNKGDMGLMTPEVWVTNYDKVDKWRPYIYVYTTSTDPTFFDSKDAAEIEDIMRTLKVNQ